MGSKPKKILDPYIILEVKKKTCLGTKLGDQLQMVGGEELHGVEEDGLQPEDGQDGVGRVEVNIGQHIGHDVIDHVLQAGYSVHEQGHPLRCDACVREGIC